MSTEQDDRWMQRALELAECGRGHVEPNPMVGCVIVRDQQVLAEGWHRKFGGPHAERDALANVPAGIDVTGATWYVTLEPCCHFGKTPPCTEAVIAAKPRRVVVAMQDPFAQVAGRGLQLLREAGIAVDVGVQEAQARRLNSPYLMRLGQGRPWVIGKWAMTLDGKIATRAGHSQWISGEESRRRVHETRGRVDAIVVGIGTVVADDPLLTARPPGPRTALRVIFDRAATLSLDSQLAKTARQIPVLVICDQTAEPSRQQALRDCGVEVLCIDASSSRQHALEALRALGHRQLTNVLVEGGSGLLASFFEADLIDELMVFVAPKLVGGQAAATPIAGIGVERLEQGSRFEPLRFDKSGDDVLLSTRRL